MKDFMSIKFHATSGILLTWQNPYKKREGEVSFYFQRSFISMTLNNHSYLVFGLGDNAIKLFTMGGLILTSILILSGFNKTNSML
jgi:hypothetical protein